MKSLEIGTPMDQQAQVLAPPAGQMPDPSSGLDGVAALDAAAQAPPGTWEALLGMIELSGPAGVVIGLFSVAGLAIVLLKLWQFRSVRIGQRRFVEPALRHFRLGRRDAAPRSGGRRGGKEGVRTG